ncbi:MAG: sulfatase-like hydrolase/transferase [bacterium]
MSIVDLTAAEIPARVVLESDGWDLVRHARVPPPRSPIALVSGWAEPNDERRAGGHGVWAVTKEARLGFTILKPRERRLELVLVSGPTPPGEQQTLEVIAGDRLLSPAPIPLAREPSTVALTIPADALPSGTPELALRFRFALRPRDIDPAARDERALAARVLRMTITPIAPPSGASEAMDAASAALVDGSWVLRAPVAVRFPVELPAGARLVAHLAAEDRAADGTASDGTASDGRDRAATSLIPEFSVERDGDPPRKLGLSAARATAGRGDELAARVPAGREALAILDVRVAGPSGATVRISELRVEGPAARSHASTAVPSLARAPAPPKHVVLVIIDAASALHASAYGYAQPTTPFLEQLAREGVRFERAYAPAAYTVASAAAIVSGQFPERTGVVTRTTRLSEQVPTIAGAFRRLGARTCAILGNANAGGAFGAMREFDELIEVFRDGTTVLDPELPRARMLIPEQLNELGMQFLSRAPATPSLVYLHQVPPHHPYLAPPPFRGMFQRDEPRDLIATWNALSPRLPGALERWEREFALDRYDENLRYADDGIAKLVERLRAARLWDDTLLVVTSDHGEAFGEHGRMLHSETIYEETIRVPLVVHPPASWHVPPHVVQTPVTTVDLMPTLVSLATPTGTAADPENAALDGIDLSGSILTTAEPPARALTARSIPSWRRQALVDGSWKLIDDGREGDIELYDLARDPGEQIDLSNALPVRTEALDIRLAKILELREAARIPPVRAEIDPTAAESLKALGYAGD